MPKLLLTPSNVDSTQCPNNAKKIDLFDTKTRGLLLEIRASGGRTYYLRYRDSRGITRQLRLANEKDVSLSQARTLADKARNRIAMGEDPGANKATLRLVPTFAQFIEDQYLPHVRSYKKSWETDVSLLKNHLLPRFGTRHMDQISRQDIVKMHADRRASGAAPGSANRLLIMMRYIFNLALRWEVPGIKGNPTKNVPLMAEHNKKERYLSEEEARRLYETGARKREVLDAKWEDFDFDRRLWRIPTTKLGKPRHVPLSDGVMNLLSAMERKGDWVFANPKTNKPFVSIFCAWNTARAKAGLSDVRVHDLRHSFASLLINSGRSLYEVQKLLGHTQVKTTQRYAHLAPETLLAASNAATLAVGSIMGVMPNRIVDVP
ncbi:MAG: site-specific integrase, partial [Betaproteobacteria bacterium]|nr:site-specific integrase [Betaproteobacteria bacterium]